MDLKTCYQRLGGDDTAVLGRLGREDRAVKFLRLFPGDESFSLLAGAVAAGDWTAAFRGAHSLKGVALNLGLGHLARSAGELTEALRAGPPQGDIQPLYQAVEADYHAAVAAIGELDQDAGDGRQETETL